MRNLCFLLTLVATLLLPGRLIAAALPQDEKLITGQLDNGLRYMIYPHAHPKGSGKFMAANSYRFIAGRRQ